LLVGLRLFFSPLSGRPARVERKMKIELTDNEIIHLMDALDARIEDLDDTLAIDDDPEIQDQISEMRDLATDLFEAVSRQDDGWGIDAEINAETQMFNAGVEAREKMKATSRAADRRALNLASPDADDRSEVQAVDVWDKPSNDPADW
jgi:hypothetical protein